MTATDTEAIRTTTATNEPVSLSPAPSKTTNEGSSELLSPVMIAVSVVLLAAIIGVVIGLSFVVRTG
ncbi:MAG: hypothetical protein ABEI52_11540 [Halobacteriaceae archaeon]